jgi:hypothetical protein
MDFWFSGRPWYVYEKGKRVGMVRSNVHDLEGWSAETGVNQFVNNQTVDYIKLHQGFRDAFAAIGADLEDMTRHQTPNNLCARCDEEFEPQRKTAKFCLKCRGSYARRNEDPKYKEVSKQRVAKSRAGKQAMELNQFNMKRRAGLPLLDWKAFLAYNRGLSKGKK